MNNRFVIFSCGCNCQNYIDLNILSVKSQLYDNYVHVIVDDASTDKTFKKLKKYNDKRIFVYRNKVNQKWIPNALQYLNKHIQSEEDVILTVDLDDWLAHSKVLDNLNDVYNTHNVWMTYSNFKYLKSGRSSNWIPTFTQKILQEKSFRENVWSFTHLRTMKAFLWKNIDKNDLKGPDGKYLRCTYDMAIGFPMLEMSSPEHIFHIPEIQYIYNDTNPSNVDKSNLKNEQKVNDLYIRSKMKYQSLKRDI